LGETKPKATREIFYLTNESKPDDKLKERFELESPVLYEYVWSVGITGVGKVSWCERLDKNDSIVVQLIFHTNKAGFSIRETDADLK